MVDKVVLSEGRLLVKVPLAYEILLVSFGIFYLAWFLFSM